MNNKAFTLIETIVYVAIFAIVGSVATGILLVVTQVQQRESASAEVTDQLTFVMQTVQRLVRESSNIEIATSTATSTLKLRMKASSTDPTCISLVSGVIKLAEGPGDNPNDCTVDTFDLTSDRVIVNTLDFKKFTQYPGHDTVSIDLTMTYNSQNPKSQVQRTLTSAIARVSAATFDSDLLPGGTYDYTLGQAGAPWQKAIVADGTEAQPAYTFGSNTGFGLFFVSSSAVLGFSTAGSETMRITGSGNVGIGTKSPGYTLTISGTAWITGGAWSGSDIRWKKNIKPLENSLNKILSLQGINFEWKKDEYPDLKFNDGVQIGLIAQEVVKILPEIVTTDNNGYMGISYERLTPVLVEAIKELKAENEALKKRIEILEAR